MKPLQLCTFVVGDVLFGIDVDRVLEVVGPMPVTPVPLAARAVRGLLNLRGQIVTAIDARARLGFEPPEDAAHDDRRAAIVVRTDGGIVCVLIDEIGDLVSFDAPGEAPPPTMSRALRAVVDGIFELDGRLLLQIEASKFAELGAQVVPVTGEEVHA